jgi:hypothetical protein
LGATTAAFGATTAALGATTGALGAAALGAILGATFEAVAFEAVAFEPVAFAAVFAVLSGIELLLFFEDFVAATFLATFTGALARPLVALRLAAAAFFEVFETLDLRVFCDTACARKLPRPCSMFYGTHRGQRYALAGFGLECAEYSTFSAKINDLRPVPDFTATFRS